MVKCADCGFLALRNEFTGQLDEVDGECRKTGQLAVLRRTNLPSVQSFGNSSYEYPYHGPPLCFVRAHDLSADILVENGNYSPGVMLEIFAKERDCRERKVFVDWNQGFTPKEHREMLDRQWRIAQEEEVRKHVEEREDRRDENAARWHKDEMDSLRAQHRLQLFWFGFAVVVATIIGSMIQAGWFGARPW